MADVKRNPVLLVILDGWGVRVAREANAIELANLEYWPSLLERYPNTTLEAGGERVGLPIGQFGNSEVGHLNLGAGRIVYQDISRIDNAISSESLYSNEALLSAIRALKPGKRLHLMGLVSDGGVHSVDRHYFALLELCKRAGLNGERVAFHVITDGRDTSPSGGLDYVEALEGKMRETGVGFVASVSGRYWAMDRDKNWDRISRYWDCITLGQGEIAPNAISAIKGSYANDVTDEFIEPHFIAEHGLPSGRIGDGDSVVMFNFRADRARQLAHAFVDGEEFQAHCFHRKVAPQVYLATLTQYESDIDAPVAFPPQAIAMTLGETLSNRGFRQFRCAETEKYAHVTYFFNGGREQPYEGETRKLIASPKVATYDLQPEMSLAAVAEAVIEAVSLGDYALVLTNFANGDMVGHTGVLDAAIQAAKAVDRHLKSVVEAAHASGFDVLITADHGNCEQMLADDGSPLTNHSNNPVPLILVEAEGDAAYELASNGALEDVAPTVLDLLGDDQPDEMSGKSLLLTERIENP